MPPTYRCIHLLSYKVFHKPQKQGYACSPERLTTMVGLRLTLPPQLHRPECRKIRPVSHKKRKYYYVYQSATHNYISLADRWYFQRMYDSQMLYVHGRRPVLFASGNFLMQKHDASAIAKTVSFASGSCD